VNEVHKISAWGVLAEATILLMRQAWLYGTVRRTLNNDRAFFNVYEKKFRRLRELQKQHS
jgi:hypothetical protein